MRKECKIAARCSLSDLTIPLVGRLSELSFASTNAICEVSRALTVWSY